MKRLWNQIASRKFFILVVSVALFWWVPRFSADHLVIIMCIYLGVNVVDGFVAGRWGNGYTPSAPSRRDTVHPGEAE